MPGGIPEVFGQRDEDAPLVVLAPMAGITNAAFRRLCREQGAGVYVSEMITSRALVERNPATLSMCAFDVDESPRSLQLYGVDPDTVAAAVRMIVAEDLADHIDINMGCPVPKVTRKGGGAALPWKRDLFEAIVSGAVRAAEEQSRCRSIDPVPVTVKMRMGIDDDHLTYLDAGLTATRAGVAWVALHARTAAAMYGGAADWPAIARLVEEIAPTGVPVLGNGDVWTAADALRMIESTGCAGVVVGRGCLGRPWLFGQLAAALSGRSIPVDPDLGQVLMVMRRHAQLMAGAVGEPKACRELRKHVAWYLKGFVVGQQARAALALVDTLAQFDDLVRGLDATQPYSPAAAAAPRGRTTGTRRVALPDGWLDSRIASETDRREVRAAELLATGG